MKNKTIEAFANASPAAPRKLSFQPERPRIVSISAPPEVDVMAAEIARLKAELAAAQNKGKPSPKVYFKVSEKGCLSVYGMGRWPVTLYRGQWELLLSKAEEIKAFIAAHGDKLAVKVSE